MIWIKKFIQTLVGVALLIGLVVVLIGLFSSATGPRAASPSQPIAASSTKSPIAPTLVPVTPSPPLDDEFRPLPTIDPHATPTPTPNSPPPTLLPTFSTLPKEAPPTGQPLPTPWPTRTPLPTLSASLDRQFSVQNLRFGPAVEVNKELLDPFGDIAWSPDGQALALSLATGGTKAGSNWPLTDITLIDASGQNMQRFASGFSPLWSPAGDLIAYLDYSDNLDDLYIRIVDANTKQNTLVTTIKRGGVYPILAWVSGNELLYFQDTLILFDYPTNQKSNLLEMVTPAWSVPTSRPFQLLATAPKQGLIAIASNEVLVILERSATGILILKQLEGVDNPALAFSPDGDTLAYVSSRTRQVKIVSTRGDEPAIELPQPGRGTSTSLAWSPDGAALVYADFDGVHLVNRDGSGLQKLEGLPGYVHRLAWSSRGSLTLSINTSDTFFTFFSLSTSAAK